MTASPTGPPEVPGAAALRRMGNLALPVATLAAFLLLWGLAARRYPPDQFPGPLDVARALAELTADGTLWANTWISLVRFVAIDLPYPRERTSDAFARYRRELYGEFHLVHQEAAQGGGANGFGG